MKEETVEVQFDGGGFPIFRSYHDYRLPATQVGPLHSDSVQFRRAFEDFRKATLSDDHWTRRFTPEQAKAIQEAFATNGPRIHGFVWHHHQDHGVLQLVSAYDHRHTGHYGGRFLTGGRPR
ncbi:MAG TPA: HNH endonuclease [Terriglobia bacterium]|nr:HNH endonuclease [Terriglobia bacterium]